MGHASAEKKHRHDVGHPEHSAKVTEPFTRAIQGVLAAAIALTLVLIVWSIWISG